MRIWKQLKETIYLRSNYSVQLEGSNDHSKDHINEENHFDIRL